MTRSFGMAPNIFSREIKRYRWRILNLILARKAPPDHVKLLAYDKYAHNLIFTVPHKSENVHLKNVGDLREITPLEIFSLYSLIEISGVLCIQSLTQLQFPHRIFCIQQLSHCCTSNWFKVNGISNNHFMGYYLLEVRLLQVAHFYRKECLKCMQLKCHFAVAI